MMQRNFDVEIKAAKWRTLSVQEECEIAKIYNKYYCRMHPVGAKRLTNPHNLKWLWRRFTDEVNVKTLSRFTVEQLRSKINYRMVSIKVEIICILLLYEMLIFM